MKTHTKIGAACSPAARSRCSGWPSGSRSPITSGGTAAAIRPACPATSIPISGRIVAVADVFDALTHSRPYKAAWTREAAIDEMVAPVRPPLRPRRSWTRS